MAGETERVLLDNARKRLEEIQTETEALNQIIRTYEKIVSKPAVMDVSENDQFDLYRGNSRRAAQARVAAAMDAARRTMLAEHRPMKRGELVERLEKQGYEITGSDKNKVFGTNMWRSGLFRPVEGRGYWPVDTPLPGESDESQN